MKRGDLRWYTFQTPDKRRPVLILTRNSAIPYLTGITVAQVTSTVRDIATEVLLTPDEDGVHAMCVVSLDSIQTVQKHQIRGLTYDPVTVAYARCGTGALLCPGDGSIFIPHSLIDENDSLV